MSIEVFTKVLPKCDVSSTSLKWFPVWVGWRGANASVAPRES